MHKMTSNEQIRFTNCVNSLRPAHISYDDAVKDLEYCENIKPNKTGLKKLEAFIRTMGKA